MEVMTILWREFVFFKRRFFKITSALAVSPILYLVAFGWGMGEYLRVEGLSYLAYILPGVIALTSMRSSYGAISMRVSVSRLHEKSFEYYLMSPTRLSLLTLGHIIAGGLRGMYAVFIVVLISLVFRVQIIINLSFVIVCFLNCILFSALGFFAAMMINTHYDMNRFTSFVITPMSFLCGTFFSLKRLPLLVKGFIEVLPLTHSTRLLRAIGFNRRVDPFSILVLIVYIILLYLLCVKACYEEVS